MCPFCLEGRKRAFVFAFVFAFAFLSFGGEAPVSTYLNWVRLQTPRPSSCRARLVPLVSSLIPQGGKDFLSELPFRKPQSELFIICTVDLRSGYAGQWLPCWYIGVLLVPQGFDDFLKYGIDKGNETKRLASLEAVPHLEGGFYIGIVCNYVAVFLFPVPTIEQSHAFGKGYDLPNVPLIFWGQMRVSSEKLLLYFVLI